MKLLNRHVLRYLYTGMHRSLIGARWVIYKYLIVIYIIILRINVIILSISFLVLLLYNSIHPAYVSTDEPNLAENLNKDFYSG